MSFGASELEMHIWESSVHRYHLKLKRLDEMKGDPRTDLSGNEEEVSKRTEKDKLGKRWAKKKVLFQKSGKKVFWKEENSQLCLKVLVEEKVKFYITGCPFPTLHHVKLELHFSESLSCKERAGQERNFIKISNVKARAIIHMKSGGDTGWLSRLL